MKLAIASDTHDNISKILKMVEIINEQKVDFFVHAGDFIAPFSILPFAKLNCDWLGVFGNNDGEKEGLKKVSQDRIKKGPYYFDYDHKKIALMHELCESCADIVICGHTHKLLIENSNKLIINPGEVCGYITNKSSIVILDSGNLKYQPIYF